MKAVAVFLVGISAALSGAFIRSCQSIPPELFEAWCGGPPQSSAFAQHQHCAGCVLVALGLGLAALSLTPLALRSPAFTRARSR